MDTYLLFALIGLGSGVVYAGIGMGVVITYRGTGVINFATGAMGMWGAYVFDELDKRADLVIPVIGIPHRIDLGDRLPIAAALLLAIATCAAIGILVHLLVFRPLRRAPILAKVVASIGVLLVLQAIAVLQFQSDSRVLRPILPSGAITIAGQSFSRDRLWLALIVILIAVLVWAYFKWTPFGLATRAAAESEQAIALAGHAPQILAGATWVLSSVVAGLVIILAAPLTVLNPLTFVLAIVPALAAALVGRLQSIAVTVVAALSLGMFQAIITYQTTADWWPSWATTGIADAVPFVIIVAVLFIIGDSLPVRGDSVADPLPAVIRPSNRPAVIVPLVGLGGAAIVLTDGSYRFGIITSMIVSIIMLSLVLLTGLTGQISLAQAALAGVAGFLLSKITAGWGVPFPVSIVLASLGASAFGVLAGVPAVRIRGAQLAVVTLAAAVALEKFVFRNPALTDASGNLITDPTLFGLDLGVRAGRTIARWQFGLLVLAVLTIVAIVVGNLIRGATGRRFLAVRSNERAAAAVGIDVAATKLVAFALAAFVAGIGGSLIGHSRGQLSADSFAALVGLSFLAFAYLGGITSVSGALLAGTFAPLGITFIISDRLINLGSSYAAIAGLGLVATAIFNPDGIAGATRVNVAKLMARRRPAAAPSSSVPAFNVPEPVPTLAVYEARAVRSRDPGDPSIVLNVVDLGVRYGGLIANDDVSLEVHQGEIVGLIGPNGAGKTTFIDAVTGFVPSSGRLEFDGCDIGGLRVHQRARAGLVRTWQSLELFGDLNVVDSVRVANERSSPTSLALDLIAPNRAVDLAQVEWAIELMGLTDRTDDPSTSLSLGQQKLLGIARALASRPRVLMLDEPAAGLDTAESATLGDRLRGIAEYDISVFLIDHDMSLVLDVCDYVYVLDFGRIIAHGPPACVRSNEAVVAAYLGGAAVK